MSWSLTELDKYFLYKKLEQEELCYNTNALFPK